MIVRSVQQTIHALSDALEAQLEFLGVDGLPADWFAATNMVDTASAANTPGVASIQIVDRGDAQPEEGRAASVQPEAGQQELSYEQLRAKATVCRSCRLHETRTTVVFGTGATEAPPIAFVGEGPGADEDRLGEPFVGKAGALLTAAITKGLRMQREEVYICNVVKCRPPENRTPLPDEVASCRGYLEAQLRLIKPRVVVTLGAPALQTLTGAEGGITRLRGTWREWDGIPLLPTFHPAYILRNPAAKREFWEDLQKVMQRLGL